MTRYPTRWVVIGLALLTLLMLALSWVGIRDRDERFPSAPASRAPTESPADDTSAAGWRVGGPAAILHHWDRRRSRAYAQGDADALGALYAAGSRAGRSDVALLLDYGRRGLRVEALRMQLLAVQVVAHAPGRWRLRVTDRVHGAVAVGRGASVMLPRDEASTRVVTLRRTSADANWQVAAVRGWPG